MPTQPVSDFRDYFLRALALQRDGSYDAAPGPPDAAYPPGYPLFLALAMTLLPEVDPLSAAKLGNCLLGTATVVIGGRLARGLGGDRAGIAAAAIFAFHPRQLVLPCLLASENLFSPLLLSFVLLAVRAARTRAALPHALAAGLLVGSMALTRTFAYGLGFAWAVGGAAASRRPRRIAAELALVLLVQHALMLPWALRNRRDLGEFTFLTSTGGVSLFIGNNPNATGDWYPWPPDLDQLRPGALRGSALDVDRAARAEALEWVRSHPGAAARLYLEKLRLVLVQDYLAADWAIFAEKISPPEPGIPVVAGPHPLKPYRREFTRALRLAGLLIALFAAGGAFLLFRAAVASRNAPLAAGLATLTAAAAYAFLFPALFAVNGRYRWPLEDLCVPLAAVAVAALVSRRPRAEVIP